MYILISPLGQLFSLSSFTEVTYNTTTSFCLINIIEQMLVHAISEEIVYNRELLRLLWTERYLVDKQPLYTNITEVCWGEQRTQQVLHSFWHGSQLFQFYNSCFACADQGVMREENTPSRGEGVVRTVRRAGCLSALCGYHQDTHVSNDDSFYHCSNQ